MTATELGIVQRLECAPAGAVGASAPEVVAEVWDAIRYVRQRDGGGSSLTVRIARMAEKVGWLVTLPEPGDEERIAQLVDDVHRAAVEIAAEAVLAVGELDPQLKHRPRTYLQRWLRDTLKKSEMTTPDSWEPLLQLGLKVNYDLSRLAHADGVRRVARQESSDSKTPLELALSYLQQIAMKAAVFAAWTADGARTSHEARPLADDPEVRVEIADPEQELDGLRERAQAIGRALAAATERLEADGRPLPADLLDDLDRYGRDIARLGEALGAAPELPALGQRLLDRDPRRRALRALAQLAVVGDDPLPAADDVRVRAARALATYDDGAVDSGVEALWWLHDWVLVHGDPEQSRARSDTVMQQLLSAGIATTLAIQPDVDRLRLGVVDDAEASLVFDASKPTPAATAAEPPAPEALAVPEPSASAALAPEEQSAPVAEEQPVPEPEEQPALEPEVSDVAEPVEADAEPPSVKSPPASERHDEPEVARSPEPDEEPSDEPPVRTEREDVELELPVRLVERGLPGVAACYLPSSDPRASLLELLALAAAARSSSGECAAEMTRRVYELDEQINATRDTRMIALAAVMTCSITAPSSWVDELLERVAPTESSALKGLGDQLRLAVQQRFEIGRDVLPGDTATLRRRSAQLAEDARRWLDRPGRTRMQRSSRLWRQWVDERDGRLGQMLGRVAAQEVGQIKRLRAQMHDFHENLERYLKEDDRGLRGHGSRQLEGAARREIVQRSGEVLQLVDEAIQTWESLAASERDARERSPRGRVFKSLEKSLSTQLAPARAEVDQLMREHSLGATALAGALTALERMLVQREGLPPGSEPPCVEGLRGRLLACDVPLDAELRPLESLDREVGEQICTREPDWRRAFITRVDAGELHHARRIRLRLVLEGGDDAQKLQDTLDQRGKALERDLRAQADSARVEIDQSWRLGKLPHEGCTRLFQELDAIEQRFDDPDASLRTDLDELRARLHEDATAHLAVRRDALRRELAAVGADDATRRAIDDFLATDDVASAEDAIAALRNNSVPALAVDEDRVADLRGFMALCSALDGAEPSLEEMQAAVRGEHELHGLDFAPTRARTNEEAVVRGFQQWYALRDDASLLRASGQLDLREHVHAILQLAGFDVVGVRQRTPTRRRPNFRTVDFELRTRPRIAPGLAPQFGTEARTLRVVLLVGGHAGPDELLAATREESEVPCVALVPRALTVKQRRRIATLHRETPTASPVLLVDTVALLYACARGGLDLVTTMRVTLPFTAVNPYRPFRAGPVPPETFFGRKGEIAALLAKEGAAIVYGGRRLGKSALLHAVKDHAGASRDPIAAIVIDLKAAGIGERNPPSALLPLLVDTLGRDLKVPPPTGRHPDGEHLARLAEAWLEQDERRRIILLMDEADAFLQADADVGFETTNVLQDLQMRFERRFKPVLAGLHQVKRFNDVPNQRIKHLGDSIPIGPLATTEALQLIEEPLATLGFGFEHASAAHRILAATRNQPSLIQLVCHHLVRHLMTHAPALPPYEVTRADVDAVLDRPAVAAEMHERLDLTLSLDSRYRVILLVVALDLLERTVERPLRPSEIQGRCEEWWPVGFVEATDYTFDALLEEMCELGLLYRDGQDGFRVQSRSVVRLLGTPEEIENQLLRAGSLRLPDRFNAATYREPLSRSERGAGDLHRRSPLTVQQVVELRRRERRIAAVVGTAATGLPSIGEALEGSEPDEQQSRAQRRSVTVITEATADDLDAQRAFLRQLRSVGRRVHKLVVLVRHPDSSAVRELIVEGARTVGGGKQADGTVCGIVTVSATGPAVRQLMELTPEDGDAERRPFLLLPLRRWGATGLRAWALDDGGGAALPFAADRWLDQLLTTTGGWPSLVDRVVTASRGRRSGAFAQALRDLRGELATDKGAGDLLAAVGLRPGDDPEAAAWRALVRYQESIPLTRSIAQDVGALALLSAEDARHAYETLRLKDVLVVDEDTRTVATEPVVTAAWTTLYPS